LQKVFCKIETKNPSGKPANCQPAGLPRGEMIPYIETKNPSGKPANCQPAGLPRGEMIPYIQANPLNFQINRACSPDSPKTQITGRELHLKNFIGKSFFYYFEKKYWKKIILKKKYWKKKLF